MDKYYAIKEKAKGIAKTARDFAAVVLLTGIPSWGALHLDDVLRGESKPVVSGNYLEIERKGFETSITDNLYGIKLTLKDKDGDQRVDEKTLSLLGFTSSDLGVMPYDQKMYDDAFENYGRGK